MALICAPGQKVGQGLLFQQRSMPIGQALRLAEGPTQAGRDNQIAQPQGRREVLDMCADIDDRLRIERLKWRNGRDVVTVFAVIIVLDYISAGPGGPC